MSEVKQWYIDQKVERTINALQKNGFDTFIASSRQEAINEVLRLIPSDALVGIGGSMTLSELGLIDALNRRGNTLAYTQTVPSHERMAIRRQQLTSDVFLTSSNAITENGQLVNVDNTGNRVAAMIFGPKHVIVIAGANKIVKNLDEAIERIKTIAAPINVKRLTRRTPCAVNGICTDCDSQERICRVTTIINKRPARTNLTIVIVREELGY